MKKIIVGVFLIVSMLAISMSNILLAQEGETIEISFKVGDDTLSINGNFVKVETPVVINGVTLVPVRVITESFGAEVDWDGKDRCVTLNYSEVIIKLYIDNKTAFVDGQEINLLEAPRIINDRTMVPLRFITENFGATVHYEHDTKQITVIKENPNPHSIKDFGLILKKTNKKRIGDSYYNWSIDFPKTLYLQHRNFNGSFNIISERDHYYSFIISLFEKKDEVTVDTVYTDLINSTQDYILMDHVKTETQDGGYVKVVYRDSVLNFEERFYLKENMMYCIFLTADYEYYKDYNEEISKILDSFQIIILI